MSLRQKLPNPIALVIQGFLLGGILFFATDSGERPVAPATESVLSSVEAL
jgi:hypothetical protein